MAARVAVVEDDDAVRGFVVRVLSERGYAVEEFATMAEALSALDGQAPDLLLLDVELPDGCGLDLLGILSTRAGRRIPAIVMSTLGRESDYARGFAAGAADYMSKPFSADQLLARCAVLLSRTAASVEATAKRATDLPERDGLAFGRYRIRRELGRGGYGRVYLAQDTGRGDHLVALKVLFAPSDEESESRLRFIRETYTLAKVSSPAVAAIYDVGYQEERLYFAMDYVEGETLEKHVERRGPLGEADAFALARGLLAGVAAIEAVGVVHRDLKPGNVILRGGDVRTPVIVDFGLAKGAVHRGITDANVLFGTPAYMSPEVITGHAADQRSDLFSFGLTIRFAVTGRDAFPELEGLALLKAMVRGPIPAPPDSLSPAFGAFLTCLLDLDPAGRPGTADAALHFLEACDKRAGMLSRGPPPVDRRDLTERYEHGGDRSGRPL